MGVIEDFFASTNEEILAFFAYQTAFFFVFYGTYRPIWAQNDITSLTIDTEDDGRKLKKIKLNVTRYGWQARKRNEWRAGHWSRWALMNPEYFYNGILWMFFFLSAAYGAYYVFINEPVSDLRTVALVLTTTQAFVFGLWTVPGFYWDLPGWSIAILWVATSLSTAVVTLYGVLESWEGFGFYLFYTIGQLLLSTAYTLAYFGVFGGVHSFWGHPFRKRGGLAFRDEIDKARKVGLHHEHPLGLLKSFWKYGLYPASFLDKDLPWILDGTYSSNPPMETPPKRKN
jgi:hypothetical protein